MHVRGSKEEGAITTSFDMRVLTGIDRYSLVKLALKHLNINTKEALQLEQYCDELLCKHHEYIREYGKDIPEVTDFNIKEGVN